MLRTRKLLLQPIEILQESTHQSFDLKKVRLDYTNDEKFKPGILNQVRAFLGSKVSKAVFVPFLSTPRILRFMNEFWLHLNL